MIVDLRGTDHKIYSQNGEDGILHTILETIGASGQYDKYYVEFGVESGMECNTRALRENGWSGLLMDGGHDNPSINLHKEFITAENINDLFAKYYVPEHFGVLSIDIDYNDLWVWKAIAPKYQPRVVVIEWNCSISPFRSLTVPYNPQGKWDGTNYYGAGIKALAKLGQEKGYHLVASDLRATNLFFVHDSALQGNSFLGMDDISQIHPDWVWSHAGDPHKRQFQVY